MCVYGTHVCVYMMCVYSICTCVYDMYVFMLFTLYFYLLSNRPILFFFLTSLILTVQNSAMVSLWCVDFISLGYSLKSSNSILLFIFSFF